MARKELKIKISNFMQIEKILEKLGATFQQETKVVDTYFNQPKGSVLKTTEDNIRGNFLVKLKEKNGKFEVIQFKKIRNIDEAKYVLINLHEIKCILKKKLRFWDFENYEISLNLIENVGDFMVIEGEDITREEIIKKFKLKNPEWITVSFDQLKTEP